MAFKYLSNKYTCDCTALHSLLPDDSASVTKDLVMAKRTASYNSCMCVSETSINIINNKMSQKILQIYIFET